MQFGLLWQDADPKASFEQKLEAARRRYFDRFGVEANTCHVNPRDFRENPTCQLVANSLVQPNCFWVGYDDTVAAATPVVTPIPAAPSRRRKSA